MAGRPRITDWSRADIDAFVASAGERPFRAAQIHQWVFGRGVRDPAAMSDLPLSLRQALAKAADCSPLAPVWHTDEESTTEKLLLPVEGGDAVEAVLIMEGSRTTACLSSQVGCPVACTFCASGAQGLRRNLTRGEILDQFMLVRARAEAHQRRVSNIVMMGMGEPLLNYGAVVDALDVLNDPEGGGIGARHLVVSTVGLRKGIDRLIEDRRQFTLAFSLHAPTDELRRQLIPFEGALSIRELLDAARAYLEHKGREVTFEYVMLGGVNDQPSHARALSRLLAGVRGTVNLIPYNENPGLPFVRPSPRAIDGFADLLRRDGHRITVRKRKGHRILAACGQLRLSSVPDTGRGEAAGQPIQG